MHAAQDRGDRYIQAAGARLRYRDEGRGPAVVLVHGWTLDLEMWERQVEDLAGRYRMIRYDRRGFGRSTGNPSVAHDVFDLQTLIQRLRIERPALIGMSQGARAVLRAALAMPGGISCVVLDGPTCETTPQPDEQLSDVPLEHFRNLARSRGVGAFRREWSRHKLMQLRTQDAAARERLRGMIERYPGRDLLQEAEPAADPLDDELRRLTVPTLIINGEQDTPARLTIGARIREAVPGARRILVPHAGHLPNLDNPDFYDDLLSRFLAETCE